MNKSIKIILIILVAILALLAIYFIYTKYLNPKGMQIDIDNNNTQTNTYTEDDFTLKTEYLGDSKWSYTITGTSPNSCFQYSSNAVVMESYPEQVNISLTIERVGDICAQVIQDVNETGTFNASELAKISFKVVSD